MKKIYDAVDRFCARHPRFGIPNLMRYIVIGTAAVYILMVLTRNETTGRDIPLRADFTRRQVEMLLAGGLLDYTREQQKKA